MCVCVCVHAHLKFSLCCNEEGGGGKEGEWVCGCRCGVFFSFFLHIVVFFLILGASGDLEEKKTIKLQLQATSYRICIPALITPLPQHVFLKPLPRFETLSAALGSEESLCFKLNLSDHNLRNRKLHLPPLR